MRPRKYQMGVTELPFEVRKKYRYACQQGYMAGYNTTAWRRSFVGAFITKYPDRINVLNIFRDMLGHIPRWTDITDFVLEDFRRELDKKMCQSSVRTICQVVKAFLTSSKGEVKFKSERYVSILSAHREPSQAVYLDDKEIEAIDKYEPQNEKERAAKRVFMIEALTGARHSDAERLVPENIQGDRLKYVPTKTTNCIVSVPVHKLLPKYLNERTKTLAMSTLNSTLRQICRKVGINQRIALFRAGENTTGEKWEYVSSHTGRRSFATNLFLRNVDISIIQRFMGHSDTKITQGYICAQKEEDDNVLDFFN